MSEIVLSAQVRTQAGKHSKHLRASGEIPGVFYAHGEDNISVQVAEVNLRPLIYTSETHIIDLKLNTGSSKKCILRDVQFDPVTDKPIHFDLQGLKEDEKLTIDVPVVLTGGTAAGVRVGGILQHIIHKVKVICLPKDIPAKIEIDVSGLGINQFVHVKDLTLPNVTVLESAESSVVGVLPPTIEKEPEPVAAAPVEGEIQEPEVVGKGRKVEEEAPEAKEKEKDKERDKEKEKK